MSHSFLLFYAEDGDRFSEFIPWADWWGSMYGLRPIIIDPTGKWKTSKDGLLRAYESLDHAIADPDFKFHTWVWMDANGAVFLDEFDHPQAAAIYCVGSNLHGFGRPVEELGGISVKIRTPQEERQGEWWSAMCLPAVAYDRWLYLIGRRKHGHS
jgi:hypothetical protein